MNIKQVFEHYEETGSIKYCTYLGKVKYNFILKCNSSFPIRDGHFEINKLKTDDTYGMAVVNDKWILEKLENNTEWCEE